MNFLSKPLIIILITLSFFNSLEAQDQRSPYILITLAKAECQRINGFFKPVLIVTTNDPFLNNLTYTISGGGLTTSLVLPASAGTFVPPASHSFIVPTLANGISYSVIAAAPGKSSNTLIFTTNFGMCGGIVQLDTTDVTISLPKECPTKINLVKNGSFFYGNDNSFQSNLPFGCNSCSAGSYCVGNQFSVKCNSWPANTWDNTLGTAAGNYMLVDGNPNNPSTVWRDTVEVCLGESYTFSFWIKSLYPDPFTLGMMINNITTPIFTTPAISGPSQWRQYSTTWVSTTSGNIQIGIRQLTAGHKRDFGIDDIFFGFCCDCGKQEQESEPHCGKFALALFNGAPTALFSKIRITPVFGSKIIDASIGVYDEDGDNDWNQVIGSNYSFVEWSYIGAGIPLDIAGYLDEESYIWMDPSITTNQSIRIDWFDNSSIPNILATQNIILPMAGDPSVIYSDLYDWESNTSVVTGSALNVFAGAAPESCEYDRMEAFGDCLNSINYSISCVNNNLILTFSCNPLAPGESSINWNYSINNNPSNLATNNMQLSQSGTYTLYLTINHTPVFDQNGKDITPEDCDYEKSFNVSIPNPIISDADITPTTPINGVCNFQVKFNAQNSSNSTGLPASAYFWQITGPENISQSGINFSSIFINQGNYLAKLTITDTYGCTYTVTKAFVLTYNCIPKFTWGTYVWCKKDNITPPPANITIVFTNKSQGGKCPQSYEINFPGDANWYPIVTTYTKTFFNVPGSGANYTVKLRMKDNPSGGNCSAGKEYTESIRIEPYFVDFTTLSCPDGKVYFSTNNDNPIWIFPGSEKPLNWIAQAAFGYFGWFHNSSPEIQYDPAYNSSTGTYSQYFAATLTATNNVTHAQCSETK